MQLLLLAEPAYLLEIDQPINKRMTDLDPELSLCYVSHIVVLESVGIRHHRPLSVIGAVRYVLNDLVLHLNYNS